MNRNLNRRIRPIAEADGLSPKKPRKISNNGTSYCYLTVFGNICVETQQYRKTPCFRVYKEKNKEE